MAQICKIKNVLAAVHCLLSKTVRLQCWRSSSVHFSKVNYIFSFIQSAVKADVVELLSCLASLKTHLTNHRILLSGPKWADLVALKQSFNNSVWKSKREVKLTFLNTVWTAVHYIIFNAYNTIYICSVKKSEMSTHLIAMVSCAKSCSGHQNQNPFFQMMFQRRTLWGIIVVVYLVILRVASASFGKINWHL